MSEVLWITEFPIQLEHRINFTSRTTQVAEFRDYPELSSLFSVLTTMRYLPCRNCAKLFHNFP
jgi:hypothetical protein